MYRSAPPRRPNDVHSLNRPTDIIIMNGEHKSFAIPCFYLDDDDELVKIDFAAEGYTEILESISDPSSASITCSFSQSSDEQHVIRAMVSAESSSAIESPQELSYSIRLRRSEDGKTDMLVNGRFIIMPAMISIQNDQNNGQGNENTDDQGGDAADA